jgi:hypothetical protein
MEPRRSGRVSKKPLTYWEEYVETDTWYKAEMLNDIPEAEMHAALEDEDFSGSDSEPESEESDDESVSELSTESLE